MKVYVVMFIHATNLGIMNIFKNREDAEEAMENYEQAAEEHHSVVDYYIEAWDVE